MTENQLQPNDHRSKQQGVVLQRSELFAGPLPPPDILEKYEKISPGAAQKIIEMAVKQSEHRQSLEQQVIRSGIKNAKLGLWFGLIIGLAGLTAAVMTAIYGKQTISGILGVGTLVALVGSFIYGSQGRKSEREERRKEVKG